jgi:hypothetical protein
MSDTLRLLLALLDIAPEMNRMLGREWPRFRDELLCSFDASTRRIIGPRSIEIWMRYSNGCWRRPPPKWQELVRRAMQEALPAAPEGVVTRRAGASGEAVQPAAEDFTGVVMIPVFYGTDRARGGDAPMNYYTGKRGSPTFGVAGRYPARKRAVRTARTRAG